MKNKKHADRQLQPSGKAELRSRRYREVKQQVASSPHTSPELLDRLAKGKDDELKERIAENPQTSQSTLHKLAEHESAEVRSAVAENPVTPQEKVKELAQDQHPDVRFRLAESASTPVEVLEMLLADENPYVAERAKQTLRTVTSVSEQADAALLNEHFAEAEELYRRLAADLEQLLGPTHVEVSRALHKLAAAVSAQGRVDEAASMEELASLLRESDANRPSASQ